MSKALQLRGMFCELISRRTSFLRVPSFFNTVVIEPKLETIKANLKAVSSTSTIYTANQIPVFEAVKDEDSRARLLSEGLLREQDIDDAFYPFASPLSYWWRMMDAAWSPGLIRLTMDGSRLPFGLFRLWQQGSMALPHQDVLRRELGSMPIAASFVRQFGINIYLATGDGGNLQLWDRQITDKEWAASNIKGSYGFDLTKLGTPSYTLEPAAGDLIIIDTECVHAISPIVSGTRLTLSGFIGYTSDRDPLVCWS